MSWSASRVEGRANLLGLVKLLLLAQCAGRFGSMAGQFFILLHRFISIS